MPAWFGDPGRPPRRIAGRVFLDGKPLAGAAVRLVSYATRAGLAEPSEVTTDPSGEFDFGERRASTYDISATGLGIGFGHQRITTTNPTAEFDDLWTARFMDCPFPDHEFGLAQPHRLDHREQLEPLLGDAVVSLDGKDVRPLIDDGLIALVAGIAPGTSIKLGVERGGQLLERDLVLWTKSK